MEKVKLSVTADNGSYVELKLKEVETQMEDWILKNIAPIFFNENEEMDIKIVNVSYELMPNFKRQFRASLYCNLTQQYGYTLISEETVLSEMKEYLLAKFSSLSELKLIGITPHMSTPIFFEN